MSSDPIQRDLLDEPIYGAAAIAKKRISQKASRKGSIFWRKATSTAPRSVRSGYQPAAAFVSLSESKPRNGKRRQVESRT